MSSKDSPLKSRPPEKLAQKDVEAFIRGAEKRATEHIKSTGGFPWEGPAVREDITKIFNLRLPEPYMLKLKYIAENTPSSMHSFCLEVLKAAIDQKIEDIR